MGSNLNDTTPAAPAGKSNVKWQTDGSGNDSAYVDVVDAGVITTGKLALARGGTHADLSGTGGTSQVLRQSSSGADVTVSQLSQGDLTSGAIANGSTATTQSASDNSTKVATTAYVDRQTLLPPVAVIIPVPGVTTNAQEIARFRMGYAIKFPAGASASYATAKTAIPSGSVTYHFKQNTVDFATVVFDSSVSSGLEGVYTQASDATFAAGDLFELVGPTTADVTLADLGFTLIGLRQ